MRNPAGESDRRPLRPVFDRRLKLEMGALVKTMRPQFCGPIENIVKAA